MASVAVLIGVPHPRPTTLPQGERVVWPELLGVKNDLEAVRQMLLEATPQPLHELSIITLIEPGDTTAANINACLDRYVEKLKPGDTFVLMLNGHGYRVPDVHGDEPEGDRWDEVFIASDGTPILDDEFARRWNGVDEDVVIIGIVDTCYADTSGMRLDHPARMLGRPESPVTYQNSEGPSRLFLSASLQEEKAFETVVSGVGRGVLSASLTEVWALTEGARDSYANLFGYARKLAAVYDPRQTVRLRFMGREMAPVLSLPPFSIGSA